MSLRLLPVFPSPFRYTLLLVLMLIPRGYGQEFRARGHPLSTYLDLRPAVAGAAPQSAPAWVESFDFIPSTKASPEGMTDGHPAAAVGIDRSKSAFRIRLQHPPAASDHLQIRVFFDDLAVVPRPKITVWNELGDKMMSKPLGEGLGLPSSEVQTVFMRGVNYLEIEAAGDGSQVRGIFLSWMEPTEILQPTDFPSREVARQPFGVLPPMRTHRDDAYLFGAVVARLQGSTPLVLRSGSSPTNTFEFELEHPPLMAMVTCEVLGAAIDAPPTMEINGHSLGASEFYLPDLADPAFQSEAREAEPQMGFRYTGWLRAQKLVPAEFLVAGLNNLTVRLSNVADSVAIRSVSLQLKYPWDKLDTVLVPALTPYESH